MPNNYLPPAPPGLNATLCWQNPALQEDDYDFEAPIPEDENWFETLLKLLVDTPQTDNKNIPTERSAKKEFIKKHLERHLGINPKINDRDQSENFKKMIKNLKQISAICSGKIKDSRINFKSEEVNSITSQLLEGLDLCNNGMYERIHNIIGQMKLKFDFMSLLYNLRSDIVERIARENIGAFTSMQVHERERYFWAAKHLGYFDQTISGHYKDTTCLLPEHITAIETGFTKYYTPLLCVRYIESILLSQLKESCYDSETKTYHTELTGKKIEVFFGLDHIEPHDCFILDEETYTNVVNINPAYIRNLIVKKLAQENVTLSVPETPTLPSRVNIPFDENILSFDLENTVECDYLKEIIEQEENAEDPTNRPVFDVIIKRIMTQDDKAFSFACRSGFSNIVKEFITQNGPEALKNILLANGTDEKIANGFREACLLGHKKIVEQIIFALKDSHSETLKTILLAEGVGGKPAFGFKAACLKGHSEIVKQLISVLKENDTRTLKTILLAEGPDGKPAFGFRMACQNGHTEVVKEIISALKNTHPETLKTILLAEGDDGKPAFGFGIACQQGHTEIVKEIIAVLKEKDSETLKTLLLAEGPDGEPAVGFRIACLKDHTDIVKEIIAVLKEKDSETLKTLLLAKGYYGEPARGFRTACQCGNKKIVLNLLQAASFDPQTLMQLCKNLHVMDTSKKLNITLTDLQLFLSQFNKTSDKKKILFYLAPYIDNIQLHHEIANKLSLSNEIRTPDNYKENYRINSSFFSLHYHTVKNFKTKKELEEDLLSRILGGKLSGASMLTLLAATAPALAPQNTEVTSKEHDSETRVGPPGPLA